MRNPELLAAFVQERMNKLNLSANDVARLSGRRISVGTVWNVLNRRVRNIATETLEGLARALQTSLDELLEVTYGRQRHTDEPEEIKLLIYFRELPPETRRDVLGIVTVLHKEHALRPAESIAAIVKAKRRKAA